MEYHVELSVRAKRDLIDPTNIAKEEATPDEWSASKVLPFLRLAFKVRFYSVCGVTFRYLKVAAGFSQRLRASDNPHSA